MWLYGGDLPLSWDSPHGCHSRQGDLSPQIFGKLLTLQRTLKRDDFDFALVTLIAY